MISRRNKLLIHPWDKRRYEQHRKKVQSAKAAVDRSPPIVYPHIVHKAKKQESEGQRIFHVENENIRLLQRLADIMKTKRMPDFWREPRPNFLSREKLFKVTPITSQTNWTPLEDVKKTVERSGEGIRNNKCSTCNGQSERPKIFKPEERMPWKPPRVSFNAKYLYL